MNACGEWVLYVVSLFAVLLTKVVKSKNVDRPVNQTQSMPTPPLFFEFLFFFFMPLARYLDVQQIQISGSFTNFQFLFGLFSSFLCFCCCFLLSL